MRLTKKQLAAFLLAGGLTLSVSGCGEELAPDLDKNTDILSTRNNSQDDLDALNTGILQVRPVNGEEFELYINYQSGEESWHINANKKLNVTIRTNNLPNDKEVYIDNVHMDTSIVSTKAGYNGIVQDTMDDRIHNSLMYGFPISDTNTYYGINEIEGENETFIEGYSYGSGYYSTGSIVEKRRKESEYLANGVWANKIDSVIDLLVLDKKTGEIRCVSVPSSLVVEINNIVTFLDKGEYVTYEYQKDGTYKELKRIKQQ